MPEASRFAFLIVALAGAIGCAAQQKKILGEPVHQSVAIVVHITNDVNANDHAGGVAELVETVVTGLRDQGIASEIFTADDDHPAAPRIELNVVAWQETSQLSRNLAHASALYTPLSVAAGLVGPDNRMVVDCGVFLAPNGRRVLWQRFDEGKGFSGGGEAGAGRSAGRAILRRLFPVPASPSFRR